MTSTIRKAFSITTAALIVFSLFTIIAETKPRTAAADTPASYFENPPGSDWGVLYSDDATENATAFSAVEADGGYVVAGTQTGPIGDGLDWWAVLAKINTSGTVIDNASFSGDTDHNAAYDIISTAGGYAVVGTKHQQDGPNYDPHIWLLQTDTSLDRTDEDTYGNAYPDYGHSVAADGTGFILGGFQGDGGSGSGWLIQTGSDGTQNWEGKSIFDDDTTWWMGKEVYSAKKASDGGYILGTKDGIRKTATTGTPPAHSWTAAAGDPYNSVQQTADGGYIGVGTRSDDDTADGTYDILLTKLNATGAVQWSNTYSSDSLVPDIDLEPGELPHDYGRHVVQTSDGGYAIVGETDTITHGGTTFYGNGENDLWILKVNGSGVLQWDLALGGDGDDSGHHIIETSDDDLLVSGSATVSGGPKQMWVIKVNGDFTPPTPAFTYTPVSPVFVGQQVSFDASASTDADGTITAYDWDFGDGNTGTGVTDDHTYRTPGTYTVTLAVTDNDGTVRSTSQDVVVARLGPVWERIIDGAEPNVGLAIVEAHGGGYVIAGYTENGAYGGTATDGWLLKVNADGTVAWERKYSDTLVQPAKIQSFMSVARTLDGGYIVTGKTETSLSATPSDIWLMKTDVDGVRIWDEKFGGDYWDEGQSVAATADGGYILTGFISSASPPDARSVCLIKTDGSGVETWSRTFDDADDAYSGYAVAEVTGGGYVIATAGSDNNTDIQLIKTNSTGESPSTVTWNGTSSGAAGSWVAETSDSGFAVAGTLNRSFSLAKINSSNVKQWEKSFDDGTNDAYGQHAAQTPDGGYIIVGYTEDIPDDVYLVKTDSSGNKEWDSIFGTTEYDTGSGILALADGGYVVMYNRSTTGDTDLCIRRYGHTDVVPVSGDVTIEEASVTEDPGADPGTYGTGSPPAGADLDNARGFEITASGPDGTYSFRITFTTPIDDEFTLYKLPDWAVVPYTVIDEYTIEIELDIVDNVLDPPFMFTPNSAPNQPTHVEPANGATMISVTPTLISSTFSDPDSGDTHAASQWLITTTAGDYASPLYDSGTDATNKTSIIVPASTLAGNTTYYFKVRHRDNHDEWSAWSTETWFLTINTTPNQPSNTLPADEATGVSVTPTLTSSAFADTDANDTHNASQWQITTTAGSYTTTVYDSGTDTTNKTSITITAATLSYSTTYYFRVQHQDSHGTWSAWSAETSFTTMAEPVINVAPGTPTNSAPADEATGVSVTPTLESSTFSDSDTGDTHAASQWQVTTTAGNYTSTAVYDSSTDTSNKTSITVPASTLSNNTVYYWRVRYKDSYGNWSEWSAETSFTTAGGGGCGASAAAASASDIASGWGIVGLLGVSGAYTGYRQKKRKLK